MGLLTKIKSYLLTFPVLIGLILSSQSPYSQANIKQFTIGLSNNPPLSFINKKGKADGYVVEIFEEIARQEGFTVKWDLDNWQNIVEKIKNKKIDMITSVAYSKDRTKFMKYSHNEFVIGWSQIFIPYDSKIENFLDLNNKTIAVQKKDINGESLISRCMKFGIKCNIIEVNTYEEAFKFVANGQVDATASNNLAGIWYSNRLKVMASSVIFNPTKGYVTIPKESNQWLLNTFDRYITQWKKDENSFYYQAKSKWLSPKYQINHSLTIWYAVFGLALFSLLAFWAAFVFKRQIARRVKEISIRNQQFSQIINLVPHIIYVSDSNGNILLANKKASKYFGMTKDEIERCSIENYKSHSFTEKNFLNDNGLSDQVNKSELKELSTKDYLDNKYTLLLSKMPFEELNKNNKQAHVTVAVDITEIKQYQKKIVHMAHYHQLSNLPNKTFFNVQLQESIKKFHKTKEYGALLSIDLDSFKSINDSQGHNIGDLLIQSLVKRFQKNLSDYKTIGHFGGDEFTINVPALETEDGIAEILACRYADNVLKIIAKPLTVNGMIFQITACIGVVIYPRDGSTVDRLIQRADTALNKAKKKGRNNIELFDKKLEQQVKYNHQLESELRQAVDKKQFSLVYQPIIDGNSQKMVGVEALLRWKHPVKGVVSPDEFIEIAEKIHLIVSIGEWVIEEACKKIRYFIDNGKPDLFIAVNISVLQIKSKNFYSRIHYLIQKYDIPPNHLEFELTESVLMEDVDFSIKLFNQLKLLGIKISIDDFGTGYSSFSYLIKLPIDKIKIDQSFVKSLPSNKNSATIVKTIIKMANELKINCVAEGIENQEQYEFLLDEGCKYYQGYHLYRPLEFTEIADLTKKIV